MLLSFIFLGIYIKKTNGNHGAKVVTVFIEANIISFLVFKNQHFVGLQVYFIFFKFHASHFAEPLVILDILLRSPEIVMDFYWFTFVTSLPLCSCCFVHDFGADLAVILPSVIYFKFLISVYFINQNILILRYLRIFPRIFFLKKNKIF